MNNSINIRTSLDDNSSKITRTEVNKDQTSVDMLTKRDGWRGFSGIPLWRNGSAANNANGPLIIP